VTLTSIVKKVGKLTADNSPSILTVIGVTGTLTTAYLTGRASFKAAEIIRKTAYEEGYATEQTIEMKRRVELVWKEFVPATATGLLTVAAIIGANRIGTRRAAALAAAYTLSEKAFEQYREKILEKLGPAKEQTARDEIAAARMRETPPGEVIITGNGNVLFMDQYTGRYFQSDMETVKGAVNKLNYELNQNMYASLNDFYGMIGLDATSVGEELGWTSDKLMDVDFSATIVDGKPCICIDFKVVPIRNYNKAG
jgi:Family of unknown function (DUF6353)